MTIHTLGLVPKPNFFMHTAGLQKITAAFWLSRKALEVYFLSKNSHLMKFMAKCKAKSANHRCLWKKWQKALNDN